MLLYFKFDYKLNKWIITKNILEAYLYVFWLAKENKFTIIPINWIRKRNNIRQIKKISDEILNDKNINKEFNYTLEKYIVKINYKDKNIIIREKNVYKDFKNFTKPPNITKKQGDELFLIAKKVSSLISGTNLCEMIRNAVQYKAIEKNIIVFQMSVSSLNRITEDLDNLDYEILTSNIKKQKKEIDKVLIGHAILLFNYDNELYIIDPYNFRQPIYHISHIKYFMRYQEYKYDTLDDLTLDLDRKFTHGYVLPTTRKQILATNGFINDEIFNNYLLSLMNEKGNNKTLEWYKKNLSKCDIDFINKIV